MSIQDILHFLHSLRALLRQQPHTCASVSLPPHLSTDTLVGEGWTQKLGWLSDAAITLSAFTANPSLSAIFPSHHGLVHIHTLPAPHTILPLSDRYSMLRGLSSSAVSTGGNGENNLAFKCMRKRLTFETLHLDLEGGVGDRRTTPSSNVLEGGMTRKVTEATTIEPSSSQMGVAAVEVKLESPVHLEPNARDEGSVVVNLKMKPKKKVAFRSDKPDLDLVHISLRRWLARFLRSSM